MNTVRDIRRFIVTEFATDLDPDELPDDFDLISAGVVDSLGLLRLIAWLADHFGIPIDDVDIAPENFRSIASIRLFVNQHTGPTGSGDVPVGSDAAGGKE